MSRLSSNPRDTEPYQYDMVLKKLETTRTTRGRTHTDSSRDTDLSGSIATATDAHFAEQRYDDNDQHLTDHGDVVPQRQTSIENFIHQQTQGHEEQTTAAGGDDSQHSVPNGASSQSSNSGAANKQLFTRYEALQFLDHTNPTNGVAERNLPDAILRLDRRHAIPRPRHKNDVLIEIEASTVDKRDLMTRPGVRCSTSLPIGVETTCLDCIGRVVQLSTHARAIHGIEVDDRVAAIYPFEYKDEKSNNHQYTLVDAALVVNVPRNVDAAMASCMTRLYTAAFQAIQLGLPDMHDRYGLNQLQGKSLLVQDGDTELGRALIELAVELGASQIFATGPSAVHDRLRDMGATPLGAETFGWELFVEEKLSLVLVQTLPTPETFESFMSLLGQDRSMVYVQPPNNTSQDDNFNIFSDDSFDARGIEEFIQDLANQAKGAFISAKFNCQLTCSQQFETYNGIWASIKENQVLFKKDLRFLLTLLSEGKLTPQVEERVCLEDVPGVQDRIELEGKSGTIVCLPTTLFEKKANMVGAHKSKSRNNHPPPSSDQSASSRSSGQDINNYAADSGYIRPNYDTLSDFNFLTPKPFEEESITEHSSFLDRATSFTVTSNGKNGESFVSFEDSFSTLERDANVNNEVEEKDEVTEILHQGEKKEDDKVEAKKDVVVKRVAAPPKAVTVKKGESSAMNKRAQVALQRKKEMRARMRKTQQTHVQQEKSRASESSDEKANVVVKEEAQITTESNNREKEVGAEVNLENEAAPPSSLPKWMTTANKPSDIRQATRNRPTPDWLKGVRPQSSSSPSDIVTPVKRHARPTPEWMNGARCQAEHTNDLPVEGNLSKPLVNTVPAEDCRDDDDAGSVTSDFNSVMNKWKAVESRNV